MAKIINRQNEIKDSKSAKNPNKTLPLSKGYLRTEVDDTKNSLVKKELKSVVNVGTTTSAKVVAPKQPKDVKKDVCTLILSLVPTVSKQEIIDRVSKQFSPSVSERFVKQATRWAVRFSK
jgi:hypothetical protein